jgi:quercetin dioxygenase-like cupin family protein
MTKLDPQSGLKSAIIPPGAGKCIKAFGDEITVKLSGADTGGAFVLAEAVTPPGSGPPPHIHANEDELFQVLEGRVSFFAEGKWTEFGPGAVVFLPRGGVHTFRNTGETPSRMSVLLRPAGFEVFFERCAAEFTRPGGPDMARIIAISAEHGIQFANAPQP